MIESEFRALTTGDIVRPVDQAESYLVTANYGDLVVAVRTVVMANPREWDLVARSAQDAQPTAAKKLCWGAKVSQEFRTRIRKIAETLGTEPDWLMAVMAFETGETFRPDIQNAAGSGATGLIQFMPSTAAALDTTTGELARMTAEDQLGYVLKYLLPFRGRLQNIDDVYMAILWPAAVGKPDAYVLFSKSDAAHPKRYIQNAGLDWNKDGVITKAEASARVRAALSRGASYSAE